MANYSLDTQRQNYLQNSVTPILNGEFFSNLSDVSEFFHLSDELNLPEDLSSIVGSFDGYSYCYSEYKKVKKDKEVVKSQAYCSILVDENLPDFEIMTNDEFHNKNSELNISYGRFFYELIFVCSALCLLILLSNNILSYIFRNGLRFSENNLSLVFLLFLCIFALFRSFKNLLNYVKNTNYIEDDALPKDFNDKFKIVCDESLNESVKTVFTYDLCEKILSIQGNVNKLRSKNGFLQLELNGEDMNSDNCFDIIKFIVSIAQEFKDNLLDKK